MSHGTACPGSSPVLPQPPLTVSSTTAPRRCRLSLDNPPDPNHATPYVSGAQLYVRRRRRLCIRQRTGTGCIWMCGRSQTSTPRHRLCYQENYQHHYKGAFTVPLVHSLCLTFCLEDSHEALSPRDQVRGADMISSKNRFTVLDFQAFASLSWS